MILNSVRSNTNRGVHLYRQFARVRSVRGLIHFSMIVLSVSKVVFLKHRKLHTLSDHWVSSLSYMRCTAGLYFGPSVQVLSVK